jgi:hypothetical protein
MVRGRAWEGSGQEESYIKASYIKQLCKGNSMEDEGGRKDGLEGGEGEGSIDRCVL